MRKLFLDTRRLDERCRETFGLSEEAMMENAARALEDAVRANCAPCSKIFVLTGAGNNGADGFALARRIQGDFQAEAIQCAPPSSRLCVLQAERARLRGVEFREAKDFDSRDSLFQAFDGSAAIIDCVFGSGFHGDISDEGALRVLRAANDFDSNGCVKISCDVPSGLRNDGSAARDSFAAAVTVTMGALKLCLFSDEAKDLAGKIVCANLGVSRGSFESLAQDEDKFFLLERSDLRLPIRARNMAHKGSFGHAYVAVGEKTGAAALAARACLSFGAGLVALAGEKAASCAVSFPEIVAAKALDEKASAVAFGMGLGTEDASAKYYFDWLSSRPEIPCVIDADALRSPRLGNFLALRAKGCVLTPHPKEFSALLSTCALGEFSAQECVSMRAALVEKFCRKFEGCVLLAKGASSAIGFCADGKFRLFVNPLGTPALAKAGSGDVLSGMVCALLAQGFSPLDSAIHASMAHAMAGRAFKNNFALTPLALIDAVTRLPNGAD